MSKSDKIPTRPTDADKIIIDAKILELSTVFTPTDLAHFYQNQRVVRYMMDGVEASSAGQIATHINSKRLALSNPVRASTILTRLHHLELQIQANRRDAFAAVDWSPETEELEAEILRALIHDSRVIPDFKDAATARTLADLLRAHGFYVVESLYQTDGKLKGTTYLSVGRKASEFDRCEARLTLNQRWLNCSNVVRSWERSDSRLRVEPPVQETAAESPTQETPQETLPAIANHTLEEVLRIVREIEKKTDLNSEMLLLLSRGMQKVETALGCRAVPNGGAQLPLPGLRTPAPADPIFVQKKAQATEWAKSKIKNNNYMPIRNSPPEFLGYLVNTLAAGKPLRVKEAARLLGMRGAPADLRHAVNGLSISYSKKFK